MPRARIRAAQPPVDEGSTHAAIETLGASLAESNPVLRRVTDPIFEVLTGDFLAIAGTSDGWIGFSEALWATAATEGERAFVVALGLARVYLDVSAKLDRIGFMALGRALELDSPLAFFRPTLDIEDFAPRVREISRGPELLALALVAGSLSTPTTQSVRRPRCSAELRSTPARYASTPVLVSSRNRPCTNALFPSRWERSAPSAIRDRPSRP